MSGLEQTNEQLTTDQADNATIRELNVPKDKLQSSKGNFQSKHNGRY